jgi:hypothetical protein
VDNENQNFIPNLLLFLLKFIWENRSDWFFGVDMGIYHTTGVSPLVPVVPDGFLSLGVERHKKERLRKSYVVWEENEVIPIFALEIVSRSFQANASASPNATASRLCEIVLMLMNLDALIRLLLPHPSQEFCHLGFILECFHRIEFFG